MTRAGACLLFAIAVGCGSEMRTRAPGDGESEDAGAGADDMPHNLPLPGDGGELIVEDPATCAEAEMSKSYVGCDYWPTVTSNSVWSVFDFAVVVANAGQVAADVTVTGPNGVHKMVSVAPSSVEKISLPWVTALKGGDFDECTVPKPITTTVRAPGGAYHLVSSRPVIVYQFNALEYQGQGGEPGKDWSTCPGTTTACASRGKAVGCFSFSNDASLLLPSTAMTGNYRVAGPPGLSFGGIGPYFAITATRPGTQVKIKVSSTGNIIAGGGIAAVSAGGTTTFTMEAGDVVEVLARGADDSDLSGSLVQADQPVQVIAGISAFVNPSPRQAADHLEEVVFPAETLGKRYVVGAVTGPSGARVGQSVRLYGNVDGTHLTFTPAPPGAPATINAGQVIDLGIVDSDFLVSGDHEFAITTLMQGGSVVDPRPAGDPILSKGDPSLSMVVAVEQYRKRYVFLAPDDYDVSYVDVVAPAGTSLTLDGAAVSGVPVPVPGSSFQVYRIKLGAGVLGQHTLGADQPVGIQVLGYGAYTSYQYPGGVNLLRIAPPPPIS